MTPAIVIGSGLGALGALRLLHRAGVPAYSLNLGQGCEARSRWYRPVPGVRATLASGAPLAEVLASSSLESGVLIPCGDSVLSAVSELPRTLAERFPSSTSSPAVVTLLTCKANFATLVASLDVPHPRTLICDRPTDLVRLEGLQFTNLFLKPVDSASFMKRYRVKACRVQSLTDARAKIARIQADGHRVVAQEYIPGPACHHYLIDGFAAADGEVRALFARRRLRMYPPDFGDSTHMISVPLAEVEPAVRSLRMILQSIRYRGIFSAEFKLDASDGIFKILEINARVWIYVEFAGRCGVDVCTMAYRDALGLPAGDVPEYRSGVRLVSPYLDLAAARHGWLHSRLSMRSWLRSWLGAQQPHFNWTDPLPALIDWRDTTQRVLRRALRGRAAPS